MPGLDRRLAELERRISPRPVPPGEIQVITRPALVAMAPAERADAFREMIRGRLVLETGADRPQRVEIGDPASMTRTQRANAYQHLVRGDL